MDGRYFISYSRVDGVSTATRLADDLAAGDPSVSIWIDKRELQPSADYDDQIVEVLRSCAGLLFLMSKDSTQQKSECKREWTRALKYKKPIIPILLDRDAEMPYRLEPREYIDFVDNYDAGLERLRKHIQWRTSPAGVLHTLKDRLADAERDLPRADDDEKERIQQNIDLLRQQIIEQQRIVDDPQAAERRVAQSIEAGIERERKREALAEPTGSGTIISSPPFAPPAWFQDRYVETALIAGFLQDDALRIATIVGRAGIGKTATVCRLLKSLEKGQLPDDGGPFDVDGIVYIGHTGSQQLGFPDLFHCLCRLLPSASAKLLGAIYRNPHIATREKMLALLEHFPRGCTVVLLDNFEDVVDAVEGKIVDNDLNAALHAVIEAPQHGVKIAITTRVAPQSLLLVHHERQMVVELDKGLESPYAENILRAMDSDGKLGLKDASNELLDQARQRTRGYPRALEALKAILQVDRTTTLQEILSDAQRLLPENVVEQLVGEAFSRLEPVMQQAMQALAVYGRPVPSTAVDYLLQPHVTGIDGAAILKRLVGMQFARSEAGRYHLHPVDQSFALQQIPVGQRKDWREDGPPLFTLSSLFHRAAEYFRQIRLDETEWVSLEHVDPLLAEFEMLASSGDFVDAFETLRILQPYLHEWGHSRQIQRMADRLTDEAEEPIRAFASGIAASAFFQLDEMPKAIDRLSRALAASHPEIDAEQLLHWRLMLADAYLYHGSNEDAAREYRKAETLADADDRSTHSAVLEGLGEVAVASNRYDTALEYYRRALQTRMSDAMVELIPNGDAFEIKAAPTSGELPIFDPSAWYPLPLESESGFVLFGVPRQPEHEVGSEADAQPNEDESVAVALSAFVVTSELGDLWLKFARLYSCIDQASAAAACCDLSMSIYAAIGLDLELAQALDLLRRIASELPDTDADEILALQEEALRRARQSTSRRLEIAVLEHLADSYFARHRMNDAEAAYRDLLRYAISLDDSALRARSERGLAHIVWARGDADGAVTKLMNLLEDRSDDVRFAADTHMLLGTIEFRRGRRDAAAEHYLAAGRHFAALELLQQQVDVEQVLALIATDQRNYEEAVRRLEKALPVVRRIGVPSSIASLLCALADAYLSNGDRDIAMSAVRDAYTIASEIGLPSISATTLMTLGDVSTKLNDYHVAEDAYRAARDLYRTAGDMEAEVRTLHGLSRLFGLTEQREAEIQAAEEAWELARRLDDRGDLQNATVELALALSDGGRSEEAIQHMENVVAAAPDHAYLVGTLGWVCFQAGDYERCVEESRRALELDPAQTWVTRNIGHAYLAMGLPDEAEREYRRAIDDRKGGEDFIETVRVMRKLIANRPDLPRADEMLRLMEDAQQSLDS